MKGDFPYAASIATKNIAGLYSNNELANSLQYSFKRAVRERHVDLGVMNYHCDNLMPSEYEIPKMML